MAPFAFATAAPGKYYASALVTDKGDVIAGSLDGSLVALTAARSGALAAQAERRHRYESGAGTSMVAST